MNGQWTEESASWLPRNRVPPVDGDGHCAQNRKVSNCSASFSGGLVRCERPAIRRAESDLQARHKDWQTNRTYKSGLRNGHPPFCLAPYPSPYVSAPTALHLSSNSTLNPANTTLILFRLAHLLQLTQKLSNPNQPTALLSSSSLP